MNIYSIMTASKLSKLLNKDKSSIKRIFKYLDIKGETNSLGYIYYSENEVSILKDFLQSYSAKEIANLLYKFSMKEKHGVENPMHLLEFKNKIKETNKLKYGCEYPIQLEEIKNKVKKTNLNKYGKEHYLQSDKGKELQKQTLIKKYNVINVSQIKEVKDTKRKKYISNHLLERNLLEQNIKLYSIKEVSSIVNRLTSTITDTIKEKQLNTIKSKHGNTLYIDDITLTFLISYYKQTDKSGTSFLEKEVQSYVSSIYTDTLLFNDKIELMGKELDIYLPNKKIALEVNGLYWHSNLPILRIKKRLPTREENLFNKNRHLEKTVLCKNKDIRLIHLFEDEWLEKKDICKSIISSSIGVYTQKIFARKCIIKEIPLKEYKQFLNENHIQGYTKANIMLGLYSNNELVQSIGILYSSSHKRDEVELNRMVTKLDIQIVGGFSKLVKNACKIYNIKTIVSYISNRLFNGSSYYKIGFEKIVDNPPTYFYIDYRNPKQRYPRYTFMRNKIKQKYNNKELLYWNENETEEINMYKNGFGRIYDCGTTKIRYTL